MTDAGLSHSPSARRLDATDQQSSSELTRPTGEAPALYPVGELLDRHWEAAFTYARLCTDGQRAAGMLTTAAFTRLFGATRHEDGPTAAWRPHLLATVRRIAAEWDTDDRRTLLHPELRAEAAGDDGTGGVAARLLPPANRRVLARAFQRLPESARCLLWHSEAEAEPLAVPAGLLGIDEAGARVEVGRSRERLREECLQVHREIATDEDCLRYHRLLDVTCRRGAIDVDPDLGAHIARCRHCARTGDQLLQFEGLLGVALAEGVLGWAAAAYLEERATAHGRVPAAGPRPPHDPATDGEAFDTRDAYDPLDGRGADSSGVTGAPSTELVPRPAAELRPANRRSDRKAARRAARRRNLTAAVLTVSALVVLPLVVWGALGTGGGSDQAADGTSSSPSTDPEKTVTDSPSPIGAEDETQGTLRGRLHNVASGLCISTAGGKAVKGAELELATCSSDAGQQWSYETDGLLRSGDDPSLCVDSSLGYSVRLGLCKGTSHSKDVRYDFTLQGTLVPRSGQNLALAPAATDGSGALVLKNRADGTAQRWVIDTSQPDPQMEFVNWDAAASSSGTPKGATSASDSARPAPSATSTTGKKAGATVPKSTGTSCTYDDWYYCTWGGSTGGSGYGYGGSDYGTGGSAPGGGSGPGAPAGPGTGGGRP